MRDIVFILVGDRPKLMSMGRFQFLNSGDPTALSQNCYAIVRTKVSGQKSYAFLIYRFRQMSSSWSLQLVCRQEVVSNSGMIDEVSQCACSDRKWRSPLVTRFSSSRRPQKPLLLLKLKCITAVRRHLSMVHAVCVYTVQMSDWFLIRYT